MHRDVNTEISRLGGYRSSICKVFCVIQDVTTVKQINLIFHCIYCVATTDSPGLLSVSHWSLTIQFTHVFHRLYYCVL